MHACVCMCVRVCALFVHMYPCACICRGQMLVSGVFLHHSFFFFEIVIIIKNLESPELTELV